MAITVSVGSAVAPAHGKNAAALLKSAEIALADAKSHGRATRSLFRPEMDADLQARRALEAMIRSAVANKAFRLHFQPIVRASDRQARGVRGAAPASEGGRAATFRRRSSCRSPSGSA